MDTLTTVAVYMIAAGSSPSSEVQSDKVDLIEINHCYDEKGSLVFDQLLFYDWCPLKSHYDLRDWRLLKSPLQVPRRSQETGGFVTLWREGTLLRKVHAETIRESWTQYDPEIFERRFLPKEQRRPFSKIVAPRRTRVNASGPLGNQPAQQAGAASVLRR
ncbi:MAG: hypothetical protein ACYC6N_14190 [Pirellulaceae bacterium]